MAEIEHNVQENLENETPKEEIVEKVIEEVKAAEVEREEEEKTEEKENDENDTQVLVVSQEEAGGDGEPVVDKENLSQTAPVAVVPPTKRVHEDDSQEEDSLVKKSKPLEETNSQSQEIPA